MQDSTQHIIEKGSQLDDVHHIIEACSKDDKLFLEYWDIAKKSTEQYSWRTLWVLEHCIKKNNAQIDLILDELYVLLSKTNNHSILRIGLNLVIQRPLPADDIIVEILNKCEDYLLNPKIPIATRVNSLQFIYEFCKTEPDFFNELEVIIEQIATHESSAGMKSRIRRIRKEMAKRGKSKI